MLVGLLTLCASAVLGGLNAFRGAGHQWVRFVIAALAGICALLLRGSLLVATLQAVGVLVFMLQPWGRWYTLGHGSRDWSGTPSGYERFIERIGGNSDALCWVIGATVFALPLALLVSPIWLLLGPGVPALYAASWGVMDENPIRGGEAATGVLIAILAIVAHAVWRSPVLFLLGFK